MNSTYNTDEIGYTDPIFIRAANIEDTLCRKFGWSKCRKLLLIVKIIDTFSVFGVFSRSDALAAFSGEFNTRTLDRAILTMESHGLSICVEKNQKKNCGGALFQLQPMSLWHIENTGHTPGFERHRGRTSRK